jgi:hypothetical protein
MPTINFDSTTRGLSARIVPFKAVFNDTENVTHLSVKTTNDNQRDSCSLWWEVLDENQVKHVSGTLVLNGADYTTYNVSKEERFTYVANRLNITFA